MYGQCSAVPVPADAGLRIPGDELPQNSSTLFLTSAHCFFDEHSEWQPLSKHAVLRRAGAADAENHSCSLSTRLAYLGSGVPLDLVVIACSPPVPMPPSAFSTRPLLIHEPVALAGFSAGVHLQRNFTVTATKNHRRQDFALHVHFTSLVSSMPIPTTNASASSAAGTGEAGAAEDAAAAPAAGEHFDPNLGYVSYKPEEGLSGGAVLDSNCSLVGIIERRSLWAPVGGTGG